VADEKVTKESVRIEGEISGDLLPELVEVRIIDTVWLGLCFGFGFGMALIVYAVGALVIAKTILHELLMY